MSEWNYDIDLIDAILWGRKSSRVLINASERGEVEALLKDGSICSVYLHVGEGPDAYPTMEAYQSYDDWIDLHGVNFWDDIVALRIKE